jgi:hypothetical protein
MHKSDLLHPTVGGTDNLLAGKALNTISLKLMFKKKVTIFCLLPAYLLLVLHAVIPHHHHFAAEEGPLTFHHGFNAHHHEHLVDDKHNDPDGHGHTAHFVHSPEFGTAMVRPGVNWIDISCQSMHLPPAQLCGLVYRAVFNDAECIVFPESPPLYSAPFLSSLSLRGPPSIAIV